MIATGWKPAARQNEGQGGTRVQSVICEILACGGDDDSAHGTATYSMPVGPSMLRTLRKVSKGVSTSSSTLSKITRSACSRTATSAVK